ncbi:hypothetical protein BDN70DRAFT_872037 [Pholiota conissans]|uniref:Uncharacterized protein n=1 Tax=Pholiota conissans TaxID=109636 RepID=A0A9P6CZ45_9AGAR|nr:hypothetical protein BDN70DRAFT_872037 [Pholiota conissans]
MRADYFSWLRNDMEDICDVFENKKTATAIEKERLVDKYALPLGRHLKNYSNDIRYSGSVFRFCYSLSRLAQETGTDADRFEFYPWFLPEVHGSQHKATLWRDDDCLPLTPPSFVLPDYEPSYLNSQQTTLTNTKNDGKPANAEVKQETSQTKAQTKAAASTQDTTPMTSPKRRPGRPRKHPLPEQIADEEQGTNSLPKEKQETTQATEPLQTPTQVMAAQQTQTTPITRPKRGLGRETAPPSQTTTTMQVLPTTSTILLKRKPGRPRKHPLPEPKKENEHATGPLSSTVVSQTDQGNVKEAERPGRGRKRKYSELQEVDYEDMNSKDAANDRSLELPPSIARNKRSAKKKAKLLRAKDTSNVSAEDIDELLEDDPATSTGSTHKNRKVHPVPGPMQRLKASLREKYLGNADVIPKIVSEPSPMQPSSSTLGESGDALDSTQTTLPTMTEQQAPNGQSNANVIPSTDDINMSGAYNAQDDSFAKFFDFTLFANNTIIMSTLPACSYCTKNNGDKFPPECTFEGWGKPCKECRQDNQKGCLNEYVPKNIAEMTNIRPVRHMHENYFRDRVMAINIYANHVKQLLETLSAQRLVIQMMNATPNAVHPVDETNPNNSNSSRGAEALHTHIHTNESTSTSPLANPKTMPAKSKEKEQMPQAFTVRDESLPGARELDIEICP